MVLALTKDEEEMIKVGGKRNYLASKINTLQPDELLIKLADRLDNIRDLSDNEWSRKYCAETRHIFLETLSTENLSDSHNVLLQKIRERVEECESICQ
jgi:(p)ppGpp synthase/HD superfamily hydrolase